MKYFLLEKYICITNDFETTFFTLFFQNKNNI